MTFLVKADSDEVMIEAESKIEALEVSRRYFGVQNPITLLRPVGRFEADQREANGCLVLDILDFDA